MATDENSVNIINPPSKKRSYPISVDPHHNAFKQSKKRVVLSELTNSGSVCSTQSSGCVQKVTQVKKECTDGVLVCVESVCNERFLYAPLIYQHLHSLEMEEKRRPLPNYMEKIQRDVTAGMREILVDWLVEVAEEYKLVSDTLFLAVSYIDRFLSTYNLSKNKLQLLGVTSMLVASKFEEVSPPHAEDYCYITDNTYMKEEVIQMEKDLLKFLEHELSNPTPKTFLRIFNRAAQGDMKLTYSTLEFLSWFLVELSLMDYNCLRFLPSMVAASAVFIARFTTEPEMHPWGLKMQRYSGYKPCELKDCVLAIHDLQLSRRSSSSSRAIREKFSQQKFKCVAALLSPSEIPVSYFEDFEE